MLPLGMITSNSTKLNSVPIIAFNSKVHFPRNVPFPRHGHIYTAYLPSIPGFPGLSRVSASPPGIPELVLSMVAEKCNAIDNYTGKGIGNGITWAHRNCTSGRAILVMHRNAMAGAVQLRWFVVYEVLRWCSNSRKVLRLRSILRDISGE